MFKIWVIMALFSAVFFSVLSCNKIHVNEEEDKTSSSNIIIPYQTQDTVLFFTSTDGYEIPVVVTFPNCNTSGLPGIVVTHGSGGNWTDSDSNGDGVADKFIKWQLSSQNKEWVGIFKDNCIVGAFPDSYSARGTLENEGDWKNPPLQFKISPCFVRNYDAYQTLELLRNLVRPDGISILRKSDIGLLGFSHGGSTAEASIFDIDAVPVGWEWKQTIDGITYKQEVKPPASKPASGGFATAVIYYPGSQFNSFFGNPCKSLGSNGSSIYKSYCDFLVHLPELDPLTDGSLCMINTVNSNGGGKVTSYMYSSAKHSFDGQKSGVDADASLLARERTLSWFKLYLHITETL